MSQNLSVRNAVKLALAVNAGLIGLSAAPGALAQEGADELEEITVTGSRIKKKDFTSNAPVATVGFEQIELTGTVNTESLLNTLPQAVPGLDRTSNNPGNGTATVNLRGLGSNRTLVLINGTRVVPTGSGGSVDINAIPNALIENIEVLTGGASAVYGSDAVAGVVNFLLKDDFEGVAINAGFEQTFEGDAGLYSTDITLGANVADGRGNVTVNFAYTDREDLFQGDRDFAFFAQFDDGDGNIYNGGSSGIPSTSIFSGAFSDFAPDSFGVTFNSDGSIRPFEVGDSNDFYNYAPVNYIQLPQTRYQATALGHFDLSDRITAYGRSHFTSSKVPQQLAPTPIFQTTSFPIDGNPFLAADAQTVLSGNNTDAVGLGARIDAIYSDGASSLSPLENPLEPGDEGYDPLFAPNTCLNCVFDATFADEDEDDIDDDTRLTTTPIIDADGDGIADSGSAFVRRRLLEVGPRISDSSFTSFQILGGLRGEINDSWSWDAYVQVGNVAGSETQSGNVDRNRFNQAMFVDVDDPTSCTNSAGSGATTSCSPINIWGQGNISDAGAEYIRTLVSSAFDYEQKIYALNFSGDFGSFELPGGAIGTAFGFERIEDEFDFRPSQALASGNIAGFNGAPPVSGKFDVNSLYAEFYLPILSGVKGAELLDMELAFRTSDYSTAGNVESYKVSASWAPVDSFRVRGGFNQAVRAPSIGELFSPQGENFPAAVDPCAAEGEPDDATRAVCTATGVPAGVVGTPAINLPAGQVRAITGGNPDLLEETADTYTIGFVFQPEFVEGLSLSLDYFDIVIDGYVSEFGGGAANVLDVCYNDTDVGGAGSPFCDVIQRRGDGTIEFVSLVSANVAEQTLKGFDVLASYDMDLWGGDVRINYVGTYTTESLFTAFAGAEPDECAGKFGVAICGEPLPEYKHRATANWSNDDWTAMLSWRYVGEVTDDDPDALYYAEKIDGTNYFDFAGTYRFSDNYSVTLGIDNLLDESPPILGDNQEQANTYPATYDVFGRTFFLRATAEF
ncbi:MAG: TonB-dependent receptor [Gammaproteobacteria bacterium]|nr:TonB-dependent receptor [Gammaproteobacteria bacterium]